MTRPRTLSSHATKGASARAWTVVRLHSYFKNMDREKLMKVGLLDQSLPDGMFSLAGSDHIPSLILANFVLSISWPEGQRLWKR